MSKPPPKGNEGFELYYAATYGARWETLKQKLADSRRVGRINRFAAKSDDAMRHMMGQHYLPAEVTEQRLAAGQLVKGDAALSTCYVMDLASIAAPLPLSAHLADCKQPRVLDLCAAPGGKSLVLAELLWSSTPERSASLVVNERSRVRRARLINVIREYLPEPIRQKVQVTGHDATRWGLYESDAYDAVLLDAPCSSESHVLANSNALAQWSLKRVQRLAAQQYAMAVAALTALKPGGLLAYSTCSLAPPENDGVIERIIKKKSELATVVDVPWPSLDGVFAEKTRFGWHAVPDTTGYGPIYSAYLRKRGG